MHNLPVHQQALHESTPERRQKIAVNQRLIAPDCTPALELLPAEYGLGLWR